MKLTNKQITEIENYISSWNLVYKEVYDEMLDHYCSEIETQMEKGIDFYSAFTDAHRQFENLEQKVSYGEITEVYGLKALESSQYSAIDKKVKKEYFKFSLKHLLSFRIVFWIFFTIFQYKVLYSQFEEFSFNDYLSVIKNFINTSLNKNDEINSFSELQSFLNRDKSILIDVREEDEQPKISAMKILELPFGTLEENLERLNGYTSICFVCVSGIRSQKAVKLLKSHFPDKEIKHFKSGIKSILQ